MPLTDFLVESFKPALVFKNFVSRVCDKVDQRNKFGGHFA